MAGLTPHPPAAEGPWASGETAAPSALREALHSPSPALPAIQRPVSPKTVLWPWERPVRALHAVVLLVVRKEKPRRAAAPRWVFHPAAQVGSGHFSLLSQHAGPSVTLAHTKARNHTRSRLVRVA